MAAVQREICWFRRRFRTIIRFSLAAHLFHTEHGADLVSTWVAKRHRACRGAKSS